jgi:hypothetical protein
VATAVATHHLRAVTGQPRATMAPIEGAFPFRFRLPLVTVPGWGSVANVEVVYDGTYNPFRVTTQTGPIAHGQASTLQVHVPGGDRVVKLPLDDVRVVRRTRDTWEIAVRSEWRGATGPPVPWTTSLRMGAREGASMNLTVGRTIVAHATTRRVTVMYAGHTVVDVRVVPDPVPSRMGAVVVSSTWAGTLQLNAHGVRLHADGGAGAWTLDVDDVDMAAFDEGPRAIAYDIRLARRPGNTTLTFVDPDEQPNRVTATATRVDGTLWGRPVHMTLSRRRRRRRQLLPGVHEVAQWTPPWPTPFGFLDTVTTDGEAVTFVFVSPYYSGAPNAPYAPPPLVLGPGFQLGWGPLRMHVDADAVRVAVRGGRFRQFSCVELDGVLDYADPTRVQLSRVAMSTVNGERMHGTGVYALPERKLRFSFDVEIDT